MRDEAIGLEGLGSGFRVSGLGIGVGDLGFGD